MGNSDRARFPGWWWGVATALLLSVVAVPRLSLAAEPPLRAGTVVSVQKDEVWTTLQARDAEGKTFWVWTGICVVGEGGTVEGLKAKHYDKMQFRATGQVA